MKHTVKFEFERSTTNTVRYKEIGNVKDNVIGVLYIKKTALPDDPPKSVTVYISDEDQEG